MNKNIFLRYLFGHINHHQLPNEQVMHNVFVSYQILSESISDNTGN